MRESDGGEINPAPKPVSGSPSAGRHTVRSVVGRILLHAGFLLVAVVAFGAYEHFKLHGESTQSLASLAAAAGFGFAPVRALVCELLAIEGKALHLVHGVGGLALGGLALGGGRASRIAQATRRGAQDGRGEIGASPLLPGLLTGTA